MSNLYTIHSSIKFFHVVLNRTREESLAKAKQLWHSGAKADANTYFQKALKVTFNMVQLLIEVSKNA